MDLPDRERRPAQGAKPGDLPKAQFALLGDKPVAVFEYCNLHGSEGDDLTGAGGFTDDRTRKEGGAMNAKIAQLINTQINKEFTRLPVPGLANYYAHVG